MTLQIPILQIFIHQKPVLPISTISNQGNQIWVLKPAQDVNFYTKLPFPFSFFECWKIHFLDCYNLQITEEKQVCMFL